MEDVARLAGVSVQTVSRVLNDKPNVSAKTATKVNDAISALAYRRNTAARTLATNSSRILGVVDFGMTQLGPYETLRAVQEAAQDAGYFVSLAHIRNLSAAAVHRALDSLLEQSVDGLVIVAPHYEALTLIGELPLRVPLVVVGPQGRFDFASVSVDQAEGARLALNHLVELGHTRVVHVSGPLDWLDATIRLEGWHREIQRIGLEEFPTLIGDWGSRSGFRRGMEIVNDLDVTGIFVANDQMALGVLHALHRAGRRVPDDISVIGFGDVDDSEFYEPALTTIRQDFSEIGHQCIKVLLDLVNGIPRESVVLRPLLIPRSSTGPALP